MICELYLSTVAIKVRLSNTRITHVLCKTKHIHYINKKGKINLKYRKMVVGKSEDRIGEHICCCQLSDLLKFLG